MPACLVLISVVKDAERIGDYCKNLLEAAGLRMMHGIVDDDETFALSLSRPVS